MRFPEIVGDYSHRKTHRDKKRKDPDRSIWSNDCHARSNTLRQSSDNGAPGVVEAGGVIAVVCTDLLGDFSSGAPQQIIQIPVTTAEPAKSPMIQ